MFTKRHSIRPVLDFTDSVDMCEQHHRDSVSIRNIIASYRRTGMMQQSAIRAGTFMDTINSPDFIEAQRILATANSVFESVPAAIRQEFDNDPAAFLEFIQNPENRNKMIEFGFDTDHLPPLPSPSLSETLTEAVRAGLSSAPDVLDDSK